jgi:hypothetical protein
MVRAMAYGGGFHIRASRLPPGAFGFFNLGQCGERS